MNRLSLLFVPLFLVLLSINGQCSDGSAKAKIDQHQVVAEVYNVDLDVSDNDSDLDNSKGKIYLPVDERVGYIFYQSSTIYESAFFPRSSETSQATIRSPPLSA